MAPPKSPKGSFVAVSLGATELKFTPDPDFFGTATFDIQASLNNTAGGLGGAVVTGSVTVDPVADTPTVVDVSVDEDNQSGAIVISRNVVDSTEVSHFKITNISSDGTLYLNDGTTAVTDGSFITAAQATAGLKFTPSQDFNGTGDFSIFRRHSVIRNAGLGGMWSLPR